MRVRQEVAQPDTHIPCHHCGQHDDQAHIMLLCTNPLLSTIRIKARVYQTAIANKLLLESTSNIEKFFIEQLTLASWLSAPPDTVRIWTGMWIRATLTAMFPVSHDMNLPMPKVDRFKYRRIARLLTHPLIEAYKQMICIGTMAEPTRVYRRREPISSKSKHHISMVLHQ